jgi:recombination protein RecR
VASIYEGPVQALIDELGRLPGVGPKSAQRIAFYLLKAAPEDAKRLARVIVDAKDRVSWCRRCFNISEGELWLPVGGDLEYADEVTLGRALEGRREVDA